MRETGISAHVVALGPGSPASTKVADAQLFQSIGPISLSDKDQMVRQPGMARWAPTQFMEAAYAAKQQGTEPSELFGMADSYGGARDAAIGALGGVFTPATLKGIGVSEGPWSLPARAGMTVAGAALGYGLNRMGADDRRQQMAAAIQGAAKDESIPARVSTFPVGKNESATKGEAVPRVVRAVKGG